MTPLERALRERIRSEGPMTVETYMEACNLYYYATRDPLGMAGDFTTAPEISQLFGEMVGAALADCWNRAGALGDAIYVELGPGRGSLASDALRVLRRATFDGEVHLVETSPFLQQAQRDRVPEGHWHDGIDDLPARPILLVANEFLDALPIRQHIGGIERRITVAAAGLAFDRDGETLETSPARDQAVRAVAARCATNGGVALFIDYGHLRTSPGDTLQAVRSHHYAPVLADPGEQDLTSHVDFEAVGTIAREAGARISSVVGQGEWLMRLGIAERAERLASSNPQLKADLRAAVERLTARDQMGELFKVIAVHAADWPVPAGFE